jgi:hypothetical protein
MAAEPPASGMAIPIEGTRRTRGIAWIRAIVFLAYTLGFVLAVNWLLWRRYVHRAEEHRSHLDLDDLNIRMGLPKTLLRSIGIPPQDDRSGLATVSKAHPGRIRVGALGDSYTFGTEVIAGNDYPSRLAETFARMGVRNVDVLNLGIQWTGLGQTYRMWEALARDYALDFVLLGPETLYGEREETFNHSITSMSDYLHCRYVLGENGDLGFVDVEGDTDRFDRYFAFLPSRNYLRFDRRAPSFLEAWVPWGRELANPFYYSKLSSEEERDELYRRLLSRFAEEAPETVFLEGNPDRVALAADLPGRIEWAPLVEPRHFPYMRPRGHLSEVGNEWVARAYAAILLGLPSIELESITIIDSIDAEHDGDSAPNPLSAYERVRVSIGSQVIGAYIHGGTWAPEDELMDPRREGIRSVLALTTPGTSFLDAVAAPLDFDIESGAKVELEVKGETASRVRVLGEVVLPNSRVRVGYARVRGVRTIWQYAGLDDVRLCVDGTPNGLPQGVEGVVRVGGRPIFAMTRGDDTCSLRLIPTGRPFVSVRPLAGRRIEMSTLPEKGEVALELSGRPYSLPIGAFVKKATQVDYKWSGPRQVIRKEGSVGRLEIQP